MPYDYPRAGKIPYQQAGTDFALCQEMAGYLNSLPEDKSRTFLVAACAACFYRYSGQTHIPLNLNISTSGGSRYHDVQINVHTTGQLSFDHLMRSIPQEILIKSNGSSLHPQVTITIKEFNHGEVSLEESLANGSNYSAVLTKDSDLEIGVVRSPQGINIHLEYNNNLFDPVTIDRMKGHLLSLMIDAAKRPAATLADLGMVGDEEIHWLTDISQGGRRRYRADPLHADIERFASEQPEKVAVTYNQDCLTYQELNVEANRLSHYLLSLGITAESRVMVCTEPSFYSIVALLAIHKAGATYVPLNPAYPKERIQVIVEDTGPALILTQTRLETMVRFDQIPILLLDCCQADLAKQPAKDPEQIIHPRQTAYIYYTSGTTGKPKGSMGSYANLRHYIRVSQDQYDFNPNDIMPSLASFTFSISMFELLSPLVAGGTLKILDRQQVLDTALLVNVLKEITFIHAGPSLLKSVVKYIKENITDYSVFHDLRHVSSGGDMIPPDLLRDLQLIFSKAEVYVIYGCSEIGCMGCSYFVDPNKTIVKTYVGKPFRNVSMMLLDQDGNRVPVGVPGEVYFGGDGVANGYLNRPDLTAEKFIERDGQRFYNTGDVGQLNEDGDLELLGRRDFQVKIRGMRVELGEVEYHLRQTPGVRDGVVVARDYLAMENVLVGYFIPDGTQPVTSGHLRDHVAKYVPDYMVPSIFIKLDELPLNVNLKVDRKALLVKDLAAPTSNKLKEVPENEVQKDVIQIWEEILGFNGIGINDNFIELGGHSLLLTQAILKVRTKYQVEISLERIFEDPTVARFAGEILKGESESADAILRVPRKQTNGRADEVVSIFPSSYQQQQLWFLYNVDRQGASYNIPFAFRLSGTLDYQYFKESVQEVVNRHETFRTTFGLEEGKLVQLVSAKKEVSIPVTTLSANPDSEGTDAIHDYIDKFKKAPFDLEKGPLLKVELLAISDQDHVLLINFHHIIVDHISILEFNQELGAIYKAKIQHSPINLEHPDFQYVDYSVWSEKENQVRTINEKLSVWKDEMKDHPTLLELPLDRPRSSSPQAGFGKEIKVAIPRDLSRKIVELRKREKKSAFVICLASLKVLFAKLSGSQDIIVGCPFSNRNQPGLEKVMGCVMNTLPIRTSFSPEDTFLEVLEKVQNRTLTAQGNQEVSFKQIVEAVKPARDASYNPLFQVSLIYQDPPMNINLHGIQTTSFDIHSDASKFDITIWMWEEEDEIKGLLEYNTQLFDERTINKCWKNYIALLTAIVDDPNRPVGTISVLSPQEKSLLKTVNDTGSDYPKIAIHQLIEERAVKTARQTALKIPSGGTQLTYQDLNQRANKLAHLLVARGVRTQDKVGICIDRNLNMVIGLLSILKAGAVYVPLDPHFPKERIAYMIKDSAISTVLTEQKYSNQFDGIQVVELDNLDKTSIPLSTSNLNVNLSESALAYIIYTSGSSGKPKGVQIKHASVVNFLHTMALQKPGFNPKEKLLAVTTISFDISVLEIFMPLAFGGQVIMATRAESQDAKKLAQLLDSNSIDVMQATPTTWQLLKSGGWEGQPNLKILAGGEPLPYDLKEYLIFKGAELWNLYGPTETTVWSSVKRMVKGQPISIGRPICNTKFKVVDSTDCPVPSGVTGELLIGGDGLAAGYLNRPELTVERFVEQPEGRYYRTGDEARWLPNGDFEIQGRLDSQIKLRGYRIELGEVEAALTNHNYIKQAVVIVREDTMMTRKLVAYAILEKPIPEVELKDHLRKSLPEYMVPSVIMIVDSFPLTPNKKVDRKALPNPEELTRQVAETRVLTETEKKMIPMWKELLGLSSVGIDEDFFDLGGHSLLATTLQMRVKDDFGADLPISAIFNASTIASLSSLIGTQDIKKQ